MANSITKRLESLEAARDTLVTQLVTLTETVTDLQNQLNDVLELDDVSTAPKLDEAVADEVAAEIPAEAEPEAPKGKGK